MAQATRQSLAQANPAAAPENYREYLSEYLRTKSFRPEVMPALGALTTAVADQVKTHSTLSKVPAMAVPNVRNDMYLASEALNLLLKDKTLTLTPDATANMMAFHSSLDRATKFIPIWVKVAVAIALGLGTMIGWKRIVVTVGEKIGKTHLTYAQGAAAEVVAMLTIGAADLYGLPVSTTHVLSSGVAGTMAANKSGLQLVTIRNLLMAWVLTFPAAMMLSGFLFWGFSQVF
jgi:PiT family inorganic phosphate transporter